MTVPQAFQIAFQHHQAGRLAEAETLYRQILAAQPRHADALHFLGLVAHQVGRHDMAADLMSQSINLEPNNPLAHSNLGEARRALGLIDEAIAACHRALELKPDFSNAHLNLGNALRDRGQLDESIAGYRRALELKPNYSKAHNNLGIVLRERGELDEAVAAFRSALRFAPDYARAHSNLIYTLHFHPGYSAKSIFEERFCWNRQFGDPMKRFIPRHANDRDPERPLRIGYVSPAFWGHVTGRYLVPLFERHDRRSFEILCYSGVARPDKLTDEFRRLARQWRSMVGVGDEALAEMIRRDGVDILVDLTQHMAGNRLPMFARQPAPVQASFAGYPESTGLDAIKHRISDRYLEMGSADERSNGREHLHLIDSFWCYDPRGVEVEPNGLPARTGERVTFGCLNSFCKINDRLLSLWARVLGGVPGSRLIILSDAGSPRQRTLEALENEGIEAQRVEFVMTRPRKEYLELYHRLDIVLDTFPYNGHTTNLDSLWMGVPVVSLAGDTPVSRAGLSILTNLGLPEFVAHSETEYVRLAVELARDLPRLTELRATLRERMQTSVLMDAPRFARNIEAAYRKMWQEWRGGPSPARQ